jgi:hypothetical protein
MIDQWPIYMLCYVLGWLPLVFFYKKLEMRLPLPINACKASFSIIPFGYGVYVALEWARGYFLMHVAHEWLIFDVDLLVALILWLVAIGVPLGVPRGYRTPIWLSVVGIYAYLFPWVVLVMPLAFLALFIWGPLVAYGGMGVVFLILGFVIPGSGGNSLYLMVYGVLFLFLLIKARVASRSSAAP